jgi:hypothetical protein
MMRTELETYGRESAYQYLADARIMGEGGKCDGCEATVPHLFSIGCCELCQRCAEAEIRNEERKGGYSSEHLFESLFGRVPAESSRTYKAVMGGWFAGLAGI